MGRTIYVRGVARYVRGAARYVRGAARVCQGGGPGMPEERAGRVYQGGGPPGMSEERPGYDRGAARVTSVERSGYLRQKGVSQRAAFIVVI